MKSIARTVLIAGAALSITLPAAAFAQPGPGPGGPPGAEGPRMGMRHHKPDPAKHAEHLREVLQLTPAQEPALQAFIGSMTPPEGAMEKMREARQERSQLTTPERLDRRAARMAERQAAFAKRAEATKRFYAALTPSQQKAFDALHEGGMGGMGKHGGRHGGWGRH